MRAAIPALLPVCFAGWLLMSCAAPGVGGSEPAAGSGSAGSETLGAPDDPEAGLDLIDPVYPQPLQGDYRRTAPADLDGDGQQEQVVVLAAVERVRDDPTTAPGLGDFAWDDGQPWQVYVEEPHGRRTYLFSRFVQLGTVEALVDPDNRRIWIVVQTGVGIDVYEAVHQEPDGYRVRHALGAYGTRWTSP
ncbi:MAG TPA: hypothetical protein VF282_09360 [Bacillota bacterium]